MKIMIIKELEDKQMILKTWAEEKEKKQQKNRRKEKESDGNRKRSNDKKN